MDKEVSPAAAGRCPRRHRHPGGQPHQDLAHSGPEIVLVAPACSGLALLLLLHETGHSIKRRSRVSQHLAVSTLIQLCDSRCGPPRLSHSLPCPAPRAHDSVWGCHSKGVLPTSRGWGPGMLLGGRQCPGWPTALAVPGGRPVPTCLGDRGVEAHTDDSVLSCGVPAAPVIKTTEAVTPACPRPHVPCVPGAPPGPYVPTSCHGPGP